MAPHHCTMVILFLGLVVLSCRTASAGYSSGTGMPISSLNYSGSSRRLSSSSSTTRRSSSSSSNRAGGGGGSMVAQYTGRDHDDDDDDNDYKVCTLRDCMPYIQLEQTIELSLEQIIQVRRRRRFLRRWRSNDKLRGAPARIRHTPIVTLTVVQKSQILSQYGNYFSRQEELPPVVSVGAREKRGSVSICPRQEQWDALVLGMTNDDELVQVVQFADTGDNQWVLDERCTQNECSFVSNCGCTAHTRLVRATVISFDQLVVAEKYIKVYCCIARLLS